MSALECEPAPPIGVAPILEWLERLYGTAEDGLLSAWTKGHGTKWGSVDALGELAEALAAVNEHDDVWLGVATRRQRLAEGARGGEEECVAFPALWLDVDIAGAAHASGKNYPATTEAAVELIKSFPAEATALVWSGHGIHAWWALDEMADVDEIRPVLARWAATWDRLAAEAGCEIDYTSDIPRIMRIPGTLNRKQKTQPVAVEVLEEDWSRRYGLADLAELLDEVPPPAPPRQRPVPVSAGGRPGDDAPSCSQLLASHGWTLARTERNGNEIWLHPWNPTSDRSATVYAHDGHCAIWSDTVPSHWPSVETALGAERRTYDAFGLYAAVEHGGDHKAAAAALRRDQQDELRALAGYPIDCGDNTPQRARRPHREDEGSIDQYREDEPPGPSSWAPVDLHTVSKEAQQPRWLARSDAVKLLYPGRVHWLAGEPEAWKSWLMLIAAAEVLDAGGRVAVIDFEDSARGFLSRMEALSVDALDHHDHGRLSYLNPTEGLRGRREGTYTLGQVELQVLCDWSPDLAVVDGVTASMALEGLDPNANNDVAHWLTLLPKPLARAGASVTCIDHVTKATEGRGRWAIGGQHKLAGVDGASFTVECIKPAGRALHEPVEGLMRLNLAKDREGWLRAHTAGGSTVAPIADIAITAYPDGGVSIKLEVPGRGSIDENQRRVVEYLALYDGATKTSLRALGNSDSIDTATLELIKAGHVAIETVGRSHRHHLTEAGRDSWDSTIADAQSGDPQ